MSPTATASPTPAMRQYLEAKRQHQDAVVFFRMGDFYEMFYEDALVASRALELTLTSRSKDSAGNGIPMCGIPFHAVDQYLPRLVRKGYRVAICEQVEDPRKAKGLVRREVVRVVSPGTLTDSGYLEAGEPSYLIALVPDFPGSQPDRASRDATVPRAPERVGVALLDLSTGEFSAAEFTGLDGLQMLADELAVLAPREIILPAGITLAAVLGSRVNTEAPVTEVDGSRFESRAAQEALQAQLHTQSLASFGLTDCHAAVRAAGGLVGHLRQSQHADLSHIRTIALRTAGGHVRVDAVTLEHLEVVLSREGRVKDSLLGQIDRTVTAPGARLLRAWLLRPLTTLEAIQDRLDAVEDLAFHATSRGKLRDALKSVYDLERLVARASLGIAGPRDLVSLGQSLAAVPRVCQVLAECRAPLIASFVANLDALPDLSSRIEQTLVDEPPAVARDGGFTRDGVDPDLDGLRTVSRDGRQVIADLEAHERVRTGISSLKVRLNRVFGYYIEVSKTNLHAVPDDYHRKQTVATGERFTTPALKEHEARILGANERILARELELFADLLSRVNQEVVRIQATAKGLAALDTLAGLAETAAVSNYTKPHIHGGDEFIVSEGRHPVVERLAAEPFVPNDIDLNNEDRQLVIITGPNMGGKSTYLRQAALMPLLAQMGSFVPARDAKIPIVDRIYARVGASDNIARGQSTFMVEMQETANILHTATTRSLVVLDEIGRGTATFDGLSIAWAVAEALATGPRARPKTLFATHYHELTDLADLVPGVVNAHVSAREWNDDIVFLRKIVPGRSDRSYGIHVARLAGLPAAVVNRAREIIRGLERDELTRGGRPSFSGVPGEPRSPQLGLFARPTDDKIAGAADPGPSATPRPDPLRTKLERINVNETTPLQAHGDAW